MLWEFVLNIFHTFWHKQTNDLSRKLWKSHAEFIENKKESSAAALLYFLSCWKGAFITQTLYLLTPRLRHHIVVLSSRVCESVHAASHSLESTCFLQSFGSITLCNTKPPLWNVFNSSHELERTPNSPGWKLWLCSSRPATHASVDTLAHMYAPMNINIKALITHAHTHTVAVLVNSQGGVQQFCWFSESEGDEECWRCFR